MGSDAPLVLGRQQEFPILGDEDGASAAAEAVSAALPSVLPDPSAAAHPSAATGN